MTKFKTSAERVANLLEKFPQAAQELVDRNFECEHTYIIVSKSKTEKAEHTTQLMCQRCCNLMQFTDICKLNEDIRGLSDTIVPTAVSQTADDS